MEPTIENMEDQFNRYVKVQTSGKYNMLDPRAQRASKLSKEEFSFIIENYGALFIKYGAKV